MQTNDMLHGYAADMSRPMVASTTATQSRLLRPLGIESPSALLGHTDGASAPPGGLGVLPLHAQAPVVPQAAVIPVRAQNRLRSAKVKRVHTGAGQYACMLAAYFCTGVALEACSF